MYTLSLLCVLILVFLPEVYLQDDPDYNYDDDEVEEANPQLWNCSTTETIRGGHVSYSQDKHVLTFHCGPGYYPYPVTHRLCSEEGKWSTMRLAVATCKEVLCPAQLQLDNGDFSPRDQWFRPGEVQSFSCDDGFLLIGSDQRNCTISGEWTGRNPVCDSQDSENDCKNPGVPPGALRTESRFQTGDKVQYQCQSGLHLLGSRERVCLENREWSGSAPRCQAPYMFDTSDGVAEALAGSLSGAMDVLSPQSQKTVDNFGRSMLLSDDARMNIFILLDSSGSISKENFDESRIAIRDLIRKLDSYGVDMKFQVISFASEMKDIVTITDEYISTNAERVIQQLMAFNHKSHGRKTGTNLYVALARVNEMIASFKQNRMSNHFNETQNIIIVATDGNSNVGPNPKIAVAQIRSVLGYITATQDHTHETLLDIYVFGIGTNEDVNRERLNDIASKKSQEEHLFILRNYNTLGEVFNKMINDKSTTKCGVAQEDVSANKDATAYTRPWHVKIKTATQTCFGSIISQNWVLTAAHCFSRDAKRKVGQVEVHHGDGIVFSKTVILHPMYNIGGLKHRNVSEFYDYDIALVHTNGSIPLSVKTRPICVPCTVPASHALKNIKLTCEDHENELLPHGQTAAFFIHKEDNKQKKTHIQSREQRPECVKKIERTLKGLTKGRPTDVTIEEYVPSRFLCSGGSTMHQDSISCKGDSGGSLFLQKRMRYFQVGVVSWGTDDVCNRANQPLTDYTRDNPPPDARDFHVSLFPLIPWLRQHLSQDIEFLPAN